MKRYWKIILLSIFIVGTFGALYIHHAMAKQELPELELVTIAGEEELIEKVTVLGDYITNQDSYEPFILTSEGVTFLSDLNYMQRLSGFHYQPAYTQLVDEERGFMRGKGDYLNQFFADDGIIVYAGPYIVSENDYELDIAILHQESREKQTFSVQLPNKNNLGYMYIMDVQYIGENLYVIGRGHYSGTQKVIAYVIDVTQEKIIDENVIIEANEHSYIQYLNEEANLTEQAYAVLQIDHMEWDEEWESTITTGVEFLSYHLPTGEVAPIVAPEDITTVTQGHHESVGTESIHYYYFDAEGVTIQTYHFESNKLSPVKSVPFSENEMENFAGVYSQGDEMFFFSNVDEGSKKLYGIDLVGGTVIYEGEIHLKTSEEITVYDLEIYNMRSH